MTDNQQSAADFLASIDENARSTLDASARAGQRSTRRGIILAIIVFALVFALAVAYFLLTNKTVEPSDPVVGTWESKMATMSASSASPGIPGAPGNAFEGFTLVFDSEANCSFTGSNGSGIYAWELLEETEGERLYSLVDRSERMEFAQALYIYSSSYPDDVQKQYLIVHVNDSQTDIWYMRE